MYNDCNSYVINNGFFSFFFKLEKSCRQGDPLSLFLFILAVGPLASAIRHSDIINGLPVGKNVVKIRMYADDTFLILNGSERSIKKVYMFLIYFINV